jgi:hypothetical protein
MKVQFPEEDCHPTGRVLPSMYNLQLDSSWSDNIPIFINKNGATYGYVKYP